MLKGSELLGLIERSLGETRRELDDFDTRLARSQASLEALRQRELGALAVLARVRVREIESGDLIEALDEAGRQVQAVLAQREVMQSELNNEIEAEQRALEDLESARAPAHDAVDAAAREVDEAQSQAQQALATDAVYRDKLNAARASDGVADLAEEKAQAAHRDRVEKGKPYEADPLFDYLWTRGYGTMRYGAGPLARLLDAWVARIVDFERARQDYWLLSELPARFDAHAQHMRTQAESDLAALRAYETAAASAVGVPVREQALAAAENKLGEVDAAIAEQTDKVAALIERRAQFAAGEDDLSRRCTTLLSDAFRKESMRALRARATRTPSPEDDAAVDELTAIRAELPRVVDEVARYRSLHDANRDRTEKLEEVRRRFKENRYDSVDSQFVNSALIATLLTQLVAGRLSVPDIWDALAKQHRRSRMRADPTFGSGRWRGPRGGGFGGFGRGGGFGGGGFGTGGGFGGGGFRTGGGF